MTTTDTSALREAAEKDANSVGHLIACALLEDPSAHLDAALNSLSPTHRATIGLAIARVAADVIKPFFSERDALAERVEELTHERDVAYEGQRRDARYRGEAESQAEDAETRAREAEAKVQALTEGLEIAVAHARKMKNAPKLVGPREVENDPRLHRLWGRWMYTEGKALWDDLKEARALLRPTPSEQGGEHG